MHAPEPGTSALTRTAEGAYPSFAAREALSLQAIVQSLVQSGQFVQSLYYATRTYSTLIVLWLRMEATARDVEPPARRKEH